MTLNLAMQLVGEIGHAFLNFSNDKKLNDLQEKMFNLYIVGYRMILKLGGNEMYDVLGVNETYDALGGNEMYDARTYRYPDEWFAENKIDVENIPRPIALLYFRDRKDKYIKEKNFEYAAQFRDYERQVKDGTDEEYNNLLPLLRKLICPSLNISITKSGFNLTIFIVTNYVLFQDQFEKIVSELNP